MNSFRRCLIGAALAACVSVGAQAQTPPVPKPGQYLLQWTPVTQYTDNTPFPVGAKVTYELWTARCQSALTLQAVDAAITTTYSLRTPALGSCFHYAVLTVVDGTAKSVFSPEVEITVPAAPKIPKAPVQPTVQVGR